MRLRFARRLTAGSRANSRQPNSRRYILTSSRPPWPRSMKRLNRPASGAAGVASGSSDEGKGKRAEERKGKRAEEREGKRAEEREGKGAEEEGFEDETLEAAKERGEEKPGRDASSENLLDRLLYKGVCGTRSQRT